MDASSASPAVDTDAATASPTQTPHVDATALRELPGLGHPAELMDQQRSRPDAAVSIDPSTSGHLSLLHSLSLPLATAAVERAAVMIVTPAAVGRPTAAPLALAAVASSSSSALPAAVAAAAGAADDNGATRPAGTQADSESDSSASDSDDALVSTSEADKARGKDTAQLQEDAGAAAQGTTAAAEGAKDTSRTAAAATKQQGRKSGAARKGKQNKLDELSPEQRSLAAERLKRNSEELEAARAQLARIANRIHKRDERILKKAARGELASAAAGSEAGDVEGDEETENLVAPAKRRPPRGKASRQVAQHAGRSDEQAVSAPAQVSAEEAAAAVVSPLSSAPLASVQFQAEAERQLVIAHAKQRAYGTPKQNVTVKTTKEGPVTVAALATTTDVTSAAVATTATAVAATTTAAATATSTTDVTRVVIDLGAESASPKDTIDKEKADKDKARKSKKLSKAAAATASAATKPIRPWSEIMSATAQVDMLAGARACETSLSRLLTTKSLNAAMRQRQDHSEGSLATVTGLYSTTRKLDESMEVLLPLPSRDVRTVVEIPFQWEHAHLTHRGGAAQFSPQRPMQLTLWAQRRPLQSQGPGYIYMTQDLYFAMTACKRSRQCTVTHSVSRRLLH